MKRSKDRLPPFVPITKEMINSNAFKRLTNASRVAYLLIKAQCKGSHQVEFRFPYSNAEEYMDRHTFANSIKQLSDFGFIKKTFEGGLYRRTNIYEFIEQWKAL